MMSTAPTQEKCTRCTSNRYRCNGAPGQSCSACSRNGKVCSFNPHVRPDPRLRTTNRGEKCTYCRRHALNCNGQARQACTACTQAGKMCSYLPQMMVPQFPMPDIIRPRFEAALGGSSTGRDTREGNGSLQAGPSNWNGGPGRMASTDQNSQHFSQSQNLPSRQPSMTPFDITRYSEE